MASGLHEDAQPRFGGHRHLPGLARLASRESEMSEWRA
jgi:hypothetical protein